MCAGVCGCGGACRCVCVGGCGCVCVFPNWTVARMCGPLPKYFNRYTIERRKKIFFNYLAKQFKNSLQNNNNNKKKDFTKIAAIAGL